LIKSSDLADKVKIMIGGAPVTQSFCEQVGADFYAPDAASAAESAMRLLA
jgi:methanogenic corrinoid protein MtbC1